MSERKFVGPDGRIWVVRARPYVRKDEIDSHVTLEFATDRQTRVISCRRAEWDIAEPNLAALLARSVASGASRQIVAPGAASGHPQD